MATEQTRGILETFNRQKDVSPNFGAEGLDEVHQRSIDRSPQTLADVEKIMKEGYLILPSLLTKEQTDKIRAAAHFYQSQRNQWGRTYFEGEKTTRVNNMVNKSDAVDCMILNERVLNILDHILHPNYLLSASQAIEINPGEHRQ